MKLIRQDLNFGYKKNINSKLIPFQWVYINDELKILPQELDKILNSKDESIIKNIRDIQGFENRHPYYIYLLSILMITCICIIPSYMLLLKNLESYVKFTSFNNIVVLISFFLIPLIIYINKKVRVSYFNKELKKVSVKLNIEYYKYKLYYLLFLVLWLSQVIILSIIYKKIIERVDYEFNQNVFLKVIIVIDIIFITFSLCNFFMYTKLNKFCCSENQNHMLNTNTKRYLSPMKFYITYPSTLYNNKSIFIEEEGSPLIDTRINCTNYSEDNLIDMDSLKFNN